ncbi:MAG: TRAP transporter substrate-binding protein [Burkholderiaceae bacterium]|jgi:TRAP-type C4-dicarboxylate transport system substrate-binding protein|nr:TRAP transporter substrate-binding protein [Burkholderiaceae bacterium]
MAGARRALAAMLALAPALATPAENAAHLRIVGGLAGVAQFDKFEKPFWTQDLPRLTGGRVTAEIAPFDQAGIRGQEMLRLMQLGVVPFGTVLLALAAAQDPILAAPDLAGLAATPAELGRAIAAFRPHLEQVLRERYGVKLLAIYAYPAQTVFCKEALRSLADLAGRRVRTSGVSQSDLVDALGGRPVQIPFAEVVNAMKQGNLDCAITGTLSGNAIGLHDVTRFLHTQPISWGLSLFGANLAAWNALGPEVQQILQRELLTLEASIHANAVEQTDDGVACNTGRAECRGGRAGRMVAGQAPDDALRVRRLFSDSVLPRWVRRCGTDCATVWNRTIGPALQVPAAAQ